MRNDDLISRDALIMAIRDAHIISGTSMAIMLDIVKKAPTVGGWISVEDRLPEATKPDVHGNIVFSDYVLTYQTYEYGHDWIAEDTCRVDHGCWMCEVPGLGCKVTHWMPLPKPPKEGDDDDDCE